MAPAPISATNPWYRLRLVSRNPDGLAVRITGLPPSRRTSALSDIPSGSTAIPPEAGLTDSFASNASRDSLEPLPTGPMAAQSASLSHSLLEQAAVLEPKPIPPAKTSTTPRNSNSRLGEPLRVNTDASNAQSSKREVSTTKAPTTMRGGEKRGVGKVSPKKERRPELSPGSANLIARGGGLAGTSGPATPKPMAAVSPKRKAQPASGPMRIGPTPQTSSPPRQPLSLPHSAHNPSRMSPTKALAVGRPTTESRLVVEDNKLIEISYDYSDEQQAETSAVASASYGSPVKSASAASKSASNSPHKKARKKRRGLFEPSAEMLAHFPSGQGGRGSSATSAFTQLPPEPTPDRHHGRRSNLAREWDPGSSVPVQASQQPGAHFHVVPDHEALLRGLPQHPSQPATVFDVIPDPFGRGSHSDPRHRSGPIYSVVPPVQPAILHPAGPGVTLIEHVGGSFESHPRFPQPHPQAWMAEAPAYPPVAVAPPYPPVSTAETQNLSPRSRRREEHRSRAAAHKAAFEAAFGPGCSAHQPLPPPQGGLGGGGGGGGPPTATVKPMERPIVPKTAAGVAAQPFADGAGGGGGKVFIKGGTVVNDDNMFQADVHVEDGVIKAVGPGLPVPAGVKTIDATGRYVLPGGIDTSTHFQLPVQGTTAVDDFSSGTQAAVAGGTTLVVDLVVPKPGESLTAAYERWRGWADGRVSCDYSLTVAVPHWSSKTASEMTALSKEKGVNAFKLFMAFKERLQLPDDQLLEALTHCRRIGALARIHAENGDLVAAKEAEMISLGITGPEGHVQAHTEEAEAEAVNRICVLAKAANAPVCIDALTSKSAASAVARHRQLGAQVWAEPIAAALGTDGTHYFNKCWRHASAHITSPPLRLDTTTPTALLDALAAGHLQFVGSDHCTFNGEQKALGKDDFTFIPQGVNGVEDRMSIVWEKGVEAGKIDPMRFVSVTSAAAAKALNIYPRKGRIAVGMDADMVVWNASDKRTISAKTHHQAVDFNVFEGQTVHGQAEVTLCGGRVVWEKGALVGGAAGGRFVPLPTHSPHAFALSAQRERACLPQKVERPPFDGKAAATQPPPPPDAQEAPIRPKHVSQETTQQATPAGRASKPAGVRNQFETSWGFGGGGAGEEDRKAPSTRVAQPPGGASRPLW